MTRAIGHFILGLLVLALLLIVEGVWLSSASTRANSSRSKGSEGGDTAVAVAADESYCTPELKQILKRVLTSCGLIKEGQKRGCQPLQAKSVAAMSGGDFNALFKPMAKRAAIIQFELDRADLDAAAISLLDEKFSDQAGASYFFVVSRASPEGSAIHNSELSERRANAVLDYLKSKYRDPDLEQEVGLLWLGEEFAQLDQEFCNWKRSRQDVACGSNELNRSAFITWVDCRL
jgi:outer membrane protein OmpA-like peptidoglycan-associated protein